MLRHITLALIAAATTFLTTSCAKLPGPANAAAAADAIRTLDANWSDAAAKNDLDATVAFYAPDAVVLPPNAPIARDPMAIRASWAGLLGPNTALAWKTSNVEVAKSGELAYSYGAYQLTIKDPKGGPSLNDTGKFLEIWKTQPDGSWKCIVDTYNSDLPVSAPPAPKK